MIVYLFIVLSVFVVGTSAKNLSELNTTAVPLITRKETTLSLGTTERQITVMGLFGCSWPDDFVTRYKFCLKDADLTDVVSEKLDVRNGLLDSKTMDRLRSAECHSDHLEDCINKIDEKDMASFIAKWKNSDSKFQKFESCLQKNTEAMNRMCGTNSDLSRVVSGAAGLHLNILNILVRIVQSTNNSNMTEECWKGIALAVHITTALYLEKDRFMENAVLCWDVIHQHCNSECAVYAKELACMQAACPSVPASIFQEFGIWQWYFLNSDLVHKHCEIEDKECAVGQLGSANPGQTGSSSLFDVNNLKKKFHNVQVELEATFQLPFHVLLGIALSIFVAFIASITLICMWKHGLLCSKGSTKSKSRYSRLLTDGRDESKSLTAHDVDDIE